MRFPLIDQLRLPCLLEAILPGRLHPDGRRYLPLIVLRPGPAAPLAGAETLTPAGLSLGVVDRHHRVDQSLVGQHGTAGLVCALSALRLQRPPYRAGLIPEQGWTAGRPSTAPTVLGRVVAIPTWEVDRAQLAYEALYTELLIETGLGVVGLRTSATADSLERQLGTAQIALGDWVELQRSRIDILGFI